MAEEERRSSEAVGEDETDFIDVDLVEFHDEEFKDIVTILKISDTGKDKLTFSIFMVNICLTAFFAGYVPQYFYIWYSAKAIILLSYRWYSYKKIHFHYFLFDFCYFTNFLILVYLWLPPLGNVVRGALFSTIFSFANGPLLAAIVLWRNSMVPHSVDKMTSLFVHISPALCVWGIRWFSTEEQGFPLCVHPTESGPSGCLHVDFQEIVVYPMMLYMFWQLLYFVVVEVWRKKRVEERQYETAYKWIVERAKEGFLFRIFGIFGPKHRKTMFIIWQFIYTTVSILPAYFCYHYNIFNQILAGVVMTVASYNGASFYIDVFSRRYYIEKLTGGNQNKKE